MGSLGRGSTWAAFSGLCLAAWAAGCGSSGASGFPGSSSGDGSFIAGDGGGSGNTGNSGFGVGSGSSGSSSGMPGASVCTGTCCTSISGKVYDPAGNNPLYNIAVYVPTTPLAALTSGASCDSCSKLISGNPTASALTDASGSFTIQNVPPGSNIPLVVQVGKWRMEYTIKSVTACQDNRQPDKSLRLPHNHTVGSIPNIAISTGGADTLECLLRRIGLDASEYGGGASTAGHIHVFAGGGGGFLGGFLPGLTGAPNTSPAGPASSSGLWDSVADLMKYDIVLLSCEGTETASMNQQALFTYANSGGRVFASHFHYAWFNTGPFGAKNLATWMTGSNDIGNFNANIETTLPSGAAFPKGSALKTWLGNVGALTNGELPIQEGRHNADVAAANTNSVPWIVADKNSMAPGATEYFSFDTPIGASAAETCGRVVFSDLHVGAASGDYQSGGQV
ncbi:MAG: carboxypeptidase regulatory-like domain-containing protein, partial [Polyangiaceae bacterium]